MALTRDHKPDAPGERERIEAAGGWVRDSVGHVSSSDYTPSRLYASQANPKLGPGLCMSRALGDLDGMSCGMTSVPEVTQLPIDPSRDEYLVLGSDGLWEFLPSERVLELVAKEHKARRSLDTVCRKLILEAALQWRLTEGMYRDDITAYVIYLTPVVAALSSEAAEASAA